MDRHSKFLKLLETHEIKLTDYQSSVFKELLEGNTMAKKEKKCDCRKERNYRLVQKHFCIDMFGEQWSLVKCNKCGKEFEVITQKLGR